MLHEVMSGNTKIIFIKQHKNNIINIVSWVNEK